MVHRIVLGLLSSLTILQCCSAPRLLSDYIISVFFFPFMKNKIHHYFLAFLKARAAEQNDTHISNSVKG